MQSQFQHHPVRFSEECRTAHPGDYVPYGVKADGTIVSPLLNGDWNGDGLVDMTVGIGLIQWHTIGGEGPVQLAGAHVEGATPSTP